MSVDAKSNRIRTLLSEADEAIKRNAPQDASKGLREASHLDPDNAEVKERWQILQNLDSRGNVVELLRNYLSTQDAGGGQKALQALSAKQLPTQDAVAATELVLGVSTSPQLLDSLTGTLLARNIGARKLVAAKLSESPTTTFEIMFERGEESFNALATIPLEKSLWESEDSRQTAQKDVFRLCVAALMEAGADHLERVMRVIARLLTILPDTVAGIADDDVFDAVLSSLDIRLSASLRSQAMLASSKLLQATKQDGETLFSNFVTRRAAKQTNDDLIIAFSAAAALFPVVPAVAAKLFLIDGFVQQLVPNLERNWEDGAAGKRKSHNLENAALELLSTACIDKPCREAIKRYCTHWLENLTEERQGSHKALAALILAKISAESSLDITKKLEDLVLSDDPETDQAIEGLAYTSLQAKIKENIVGNGNLVHQLVRSLKERPAVAFGCLTVFANVTAYRAVLSEEQKKMLQLSAYAKSEKQLAEDPLDDETHVTARCRKLLDADLVPALLANCKQATSLTTVSLVVKILHSLAKEQKHRTKMAQQGTVKLLLQIRERIAKTDKSSTEASSIERNAAHALARLLISVNPSHMFSAGFPASSAVSALVPLLLPDQDSEQRNLLPTFEALLALTNLASMEDNSIRDLELRLLWPQLEDQLLFSSNVMIQRASVELVCNLMASPKCVAKFVGDGSKREATRMQILLALADVDDLATRRAAGGALAMLMAWDAAVDAVIDQHADSGPKGIKILLKMCCEESDEMKHRGFACLANIVNTPGAVGKKGVERVKQEGGAAVVQKSLKHTSNRDVVEVGVEVLKKIM